MSRWKTLLMVEYELRMLRSTLQLNARKPSYLVSYGAVFFTCLFMGYSLTLAPEYLLMGKLPQALASSEEAARDLLAALFAFPLLYTVVQSVFSRGLRSCVNEVDMKVLGSTPIDSRSIITAKCLRSLVSRASLTVFAALVIAPVALSLRTPSVLYLAALAAFALYIGFLQAVSYTAHVARDALSSRLSRHVKKMLRVTAVTVSAALLSITVLSTYLGLEPWALPLSEEVGVIWAFLPNSLAASLMLESILGRPVALASLLSLGAFLSIALTFVYLGSGAYHPEELSPRLLASEPVNPLGFRIGRFLERRLGSERPSLLIFSKDVQLALRGTLMEFSLAGFTVTYVVSLALWYLLESFLPLEAIPEFQTRFRPLETFVQEFVIILALLPFIPSLGSFSRESGKLWLLKVFPLGKEAIVYGKFLFALTLSAASLTPMVIVASLTLQMPFSWWTLSAVLPLIMLIANSVGVLVGVYLPPYDLSLQISLRSLSAFFMLLTLVLAPFTLVMIPRSSSEVFLLAMLAIYSVVLVRFFLREAGKGFEKLDVKMTLPLPTQSDARPSPVTDSQ